MANEIENDNLSFGIQDTIEMGMGNSELLSDLLTPETSTADPKEIVDINTPDPAPAPAPASAAAKPEDTPPAKPEDEVPNGLLDFLEADEEEDTPPASDKPAAKVETPEDKPSTEDTPSEDTPPQEGTQFGALANDLIELGVFSGPEEGEEATPITTPEEFLEKFKVEKQKGAIEIVDNFIGQFGQKHQDAFDSIFVKGIDPEEYYRTAGKIESFAKLDLTNEGNQERVVRQSLVDQGWETEDVDTEVEKLKNYGDLENSAQRHHKVLIKKETAALTAKTAQAQAEQGQKLKVKQDYINNVNTILQDKIKEKGFDGIPLNTKTANELQDFLLVDKWKTDSGETLTDFDRYILDLKRPENHANKVKVALLLKLLEKDPNLSTIQKKGVSKKSNVLFKEVSRQVSKEPNSNTSGKSWWK